MRTIPTRKPAACLPAGKKDGRPPAAPQQLPSQLPPLCLPCPPPALQIYAVCQLHGRIAYKRAGGSRLITHNEHWKSQIRHALYTGERFQR